MSPPRKADSTRAGTDRVEIILAPGQRERIADLGLTVSELARHLIDLALAELDPRAVDGDGEPVPVADRARLRPHGLVATGRSTMLARLDLADEAGLQAALAAVPAGWSARTVTTGRVRVIAHPDQAWRVIDGGYPDTPPRGGAPDDAA